MCPDAPSACAPQYTGDPIIYAQEAVRIIQEPLQWLVVGVILLFVVLITILVAWSTSNAKG